MSTKAIRIRFTISSYDSKLLDEAVKKIVITGKKTGAIMVGPIPLPNRSKIFTVLRSPHVDKESREQFDIVKHKRIIDLLSPQEQTMKALMQLNLSAGVDVKIG